MDRPDFLCIGAQKSGTTWLYANLLKHGEIWTPPIKEFHYFNRISMNEKLLGNWGMPIPNRNKMYWQAAKRFNIIELRWLRQYYRQGLEKSWYLSLFQQKYKLGKKCGDMTPGYSTLEERGVRYARDVIGEDTPIIFTIRNPIERSWSAAKMMLRYQGIAVSDKNIDTIQALLASPTISLCSEYSRIIPIWQKYFKNFHVLTYDELCLSPDSYLQKISEIINIKNDWDDDSKRQQVWSDKKNISLPPAIKRTLANQYRQEIIDTVKIVNTPYTQQWKTEF